MVTAWLRRGYGVVMAWLWGGYDWLRRGVLLAAGCWRFAGGLLQHGWGRLERDWGRLGRGYGVVKAWLRRGHGVVMGRLRRGSGVACCWRLVGCWLVGCWRVGALIFRLLRGVFVCACCAVIFRGLRPGGSWRSLVGSWQVVGGLLAGSCCWRLDGAASSHNAQLPGCCRLVGCWLAS